MARWLIVRTEPCRERIASFFLDALHAVQSYLPYLNAQRVTRGRLVSAPRPLFPCYIFCEDDGNTLRRFRDTPGACGVVMGAGVPARVEQAELDEIRLRLAKMEAEDKGPPAPYTRGESIRTLSGLDAIFLEPDGEKRARIMITLFARRIEANVPLAQLVGRS